jgi:glycerophosphoryl diester phosphodiesterase
MPGPDWSLPAVLAHRCGGRLAPENTLAGLAAASANGCGGVEFDVMLSGSGSPVLIHDETLERTTDGRGRVADTPDDVLLAVDAGSWFDRRFAGERIPTLDATAARCIALGLAVNLEIKPTKGTDEATAEIVAWRASQLWTGALMQPLLSSFSVRALETAAAVAPALQRGLLVGEVPADWLVRCQRLGVVSLHVDHRHLDRAVVAAAQDAGLRVVTYTVNDPLRARTLFDWGVDCVITDRPDIVRHPSGTGA